MGHTNIIGSRKVRSLRFCVDNRNLNALTKRDTYPVPSMPKRIDFLGGAAMFSTMDAIKNYWLGKIKKTNRSNTAFKFYHSLYSFIQTPFG